MIALLTALLTAIPALEAIVRAAIAAIDKTRNQKADAQYAQNKSDIAADYDRAVRLRADTAGEQHPPPAQPPPIPGGPDGGP